MEARAFRRDVMLCYCIRSYEATHMHRKTRLMHCPEVHRRRKVGVNNRPKRTRSEETLLISCEGAGLSVYSPQEQGESLRER
jgi:hypothetical protein